MSIQKHTLRKTFTTTVSALALVTAMGGMEAHAAALTGDFDSTNAGSAFAGNIATFNAATPIDLDGFTATIHADIAEAITAAISGTGDLNIYQTSDGAPTNTDTFSATIGAGTPLTLIQVGDSLDKGASASFSENVSATTLRMEDGNAADESATARFLKNLTTTNITFENAGASSTKLFINGSTAQTIGGRIDGASDGKGILEIIDPDNGADTDTDTFSDEIGFDHSIATITIGSLKSESGSAHFSKSVKATTINVYAGNNSGEDSAATFDADVTATDINITAGNNNLTATASIDFKTSLALGGTMTLTSNNAAGGDALATVRGNITGTNAIVLDDDTAGRSSITFTTLLAGNDAVSSTIDGSAAGEGAIHITGALHTVTFSGNIGATRSVRSINVGGGGQATSGIFQGTVATAEGITIGVTDQANGASKASFYKTVTSDITFANTTNNDSVTFDSAGGVFTVTGAISGSTEVAELNADSNTVNIAGSTNLVTIATETGADIGTIAVGSSTKAGNVSFSNHATAYRLLITGGDTLGETAVAAFTRNLSTTLITLNDTTGAATLQIDGGLSQTISGAIDGETAGDGTIIVIESNDNGLPDVDTFSGVIGGTRKVGSILIGSATKAGGAAFSANLSATTLTVTGGNQADEDSTADVNGDVTTTSISLVDTADGGSATLLVSGTGDQTITGTIDGEADGEGTISVLDDGNTALFASAVGATHAIKNIQVGNATNASHAAFAASVKATTLTVTAKNNELTDDSSVSFNANVTAAIVLDNSNTSSATASFDGDEAQTLTGSINGSADGNGVVEFNNTTTVTGNIGETLLESITLATGKTLTIGVADGTRRLGADTITINGTLHPLGQIILTQGSELTFGNDSTITVDDPADFAETALFDASNTATVIIGTSANGRVNISLDDSFTSGSMILFDAVGGTYTKTGDFTITDNGSIHYTVTNTDGLIKITASTADTGGGNGGEGDGEEDDVPGVVTTPESDAALAALRAAVAGNAGLTAQINGILTSGDAGAINRLIQQSGNPTAAMSSTSSVAASVARAAVTAIATRLSSSILVSEHTAMNDTPSGMAAGSPVAFNNKTLWAQPFYTNINEQGTRAVSGYNAESSGMIMGADLYHDAMTTVGVAFTYAKTNVDGDSLARDSTTIDNYQLTAYGTYRTPTWYVNGFAGYGINDVTTKRHVTFANLNLLAAGEYSGMQYQAKTDAGLPIEFAKDTFITPLVGLDYLHITNDDYTETGAGVQNIRVSLKDMDILQSSLGVQLHTIIKGADGGKFIPQVHASALYEFFGEEARSTSQYTGGGAAFNLTGNKNEQLGGNAGAGLTYSLDNISVSAGYDAEFKNNYLSHTGTVEARFKF